jgi:putative ABC transport system permease protein
MLALGIGANTAIFSVIDAVVLRPLPYNSPDRLMMVGEIHQTKGGELGPVSYPNHRDWKEQNRTFEHIAAFRGTHHNLAGFDEPERIDGVRVSADFFAMLRTEAALGRTFRPEEDRAGAEAVVVISDGLWRRRFSADPMLIGKTLTLDGAAFTVIGILPPDFSFPIYREYGGPLEIPDPEVWTTTALDAGWFSDRGWHPITAAGRLRPGVSLAQAQADMDAIAHRLEEQYPATNAKRGIGLVPLHEQVVGQVRPALLVLLGAVGLVLLIACANVAGLLLTRGMDRQNQLAVRAALGAARGRLVRQLLAETVLLAGIGGVLALLLASWAVDALVAFIPSDLPRLDAIRLDWRVLGFTLVVTVLTALIFGLLPAMHATRGDLNAALKQGGRGSTVATRYRLRKALVVCEVALALVLLVGAGLLTRSLQRLMDVSPGFDTDRLLTFRMSAPFASYSDPVGRAQLYRNVLERLERLPGVTAVGASTAVPMGGGGIALSLRIVGRPEPAPGERMAAMHGTISADYFRALGVPLLRGRYFTEHDGPGAPGVMIINETMARHFWTDQDPIGQHVYLGSQFSDDEPESFEIVGMVADLHGKSLDRSAMRHMYVPFEQQTWPFMEFAVRTLGNPQELVGAVRSEIAAIKSDEAPYNFTTMSEFLSRSIGQRRFAALLLGVFAAVALTLAIIGIYGMLSYTAAQRTHEIGVRMALGAERSDVLRLVLKQGLGLTMVGVGIGLVVSLVSSRLLSSLLYEVGATDATTFIGVSMLLVAAASLACYIPARRATKVDPMVALRYE